MSSAAYHRQYYLNNKEKFRGYWAKSYAKHRSEIIARASLWNKDNSERASATFRKSRRKACLDPSKRLAMRLRTRIYKALMGTHKSTQTVELLGCSIEHLRHYLESKFSPGMSWENYGPIWHVDHVRPCISFDLGITEEQLRCFNHTNLQPLFAKDNLSKGGHYLKQL